MRFPRISLCQVAYGVVLTLGISFVFSTAAYSETAPDTAWTARYMGPYSYWSWPYDVTTDFDGNVYVTGPSSNGRNNDFATIKYDPEGHPLWVARYDGGSSYGDSSKFVAVDAYGNVYVTGKSWGRYADYATVKYDSEGHQLWVARYDNGFYDDPYAFAVDSDGNVYVTGISSNGSNNDYGTVKYDSDGRLLWVARYDFGHFDAAMGLDVDDSGNVYVNGYSNNGANNDYATVKYDSDGNQLWARRYDNGGYGDSGGPVKVDAFGNVYVTGLSWQGYNADYGTLKYDPDGNLLWVAHYDNGGYDNPTGGMVLDSSGNVYVTGSSFSYEMTYYDYATVKYDTDGNKLWVARYDHGTADNARDIAIDESDNIYVTGNTSDPYTTVKYNSDGNPLWVVQNGTEDGFGGKAGALTVDASGNVVVTGFGKFQSPIPKPMEIYTVKFDSGDISNQPPALNLINLKTVDAGSLLTFKISGSDPEGDSLTYSAWNLPAGADFDPATCTFSWTPNGRQAGLYSVAFSVSDGDLSASQWVPIIVNDVNRPPVAGAGPDRQVELAGPAGSSVALDGSGSSDPDGDRLSYTWTGPFGSAGGVKPTVLLPPGTHVVTLMVSNGKAQDSDTVTITVRDTTPPEIKSATPDPAVLWPPNHKMVPVNLIVDVSDASGTQACRIIAVASSEPESGLGSGDTVPDFEITGDLSVNLRAERSGTGPGRIYTLTVQCTDRSENSSTRGVLVSVPHDQG